MRLHRFDGTTYQPARDSRRLSKQWERVRDLMLDGRWRTLRQIADATNCPEASVSARLRDLRKPRFGGYTVERKAQPNGLHLYRVPVGQPVDEPKHEPLPPAPEPEPVLFRDGPVNAIFDTEAA